MKKGWLGVGALVLGLVALLGLLAYSLDHLRASARVVPGLGDAAEPGRLEALAVPEAGAGEDALEVARQAVPAAVRESTGLVVRVVDEEGKRISFVDVLAYRDGELVRADHAMSGTATLLPFDGPGSLRAEHDGLELARLEIPVGHGEYDVVVPPQASVAGIVLVGGVPREGIRLWFSRGSVDWLGAWVAYGLETAGLYERPTQYGETTGADGRFRHEWLAPGWSGVLRLVDHDDFRFVNGAHRIELARPDEALVVELEAIHAELEFHGRVVFAGRPVPGARWQSNGSSWGRCDELGRFSIHAFADEQESLRLEFAQAELGARVVEVAAGTGADLGDVELVPERAVAFVVRSESGAPIAGARARPRSRVKTLLRLTTLVMQDSNPFESVQRSSVMTDSAGRGVLRSLRAEEREFVVSARGYALTGALVPDVLTEPIPVVLPRCAAVQVTLRDRSGRVPPGLQVRLQARGQPFTWANGRGPVGDELTPENLFGGGSTVAPEDAAYSGKFWPYAGGRVWIDALRPGMPFDLAVVDEYGSVLAAERGLVVNSGEWRRVEFRVEAAARTLLVVVRDTLGHPLPRANLKVWTPAGSEPSWSKLHTDRAGMLRTEPLYADEVTLQVSRNGFESRTLEHVAVPPEGATVELRLAHDWWPW